MILNQYVHLNVPHTNTVNNNCILAVCVAGFYGDGCNQTCTCTNGGSCDPVHGQCICPAGFHGDSCEQGMQSYLNRFWYI